GSIFLTAVIESESSTSILISDLLVVSFPIISDCFSIDFVLVFSPLILISSMLLSKFEPSMLMISTSVCFSFSLPFDALWDTPSDWLLQSFNCCLGLELAANVQFLEFPFSFVSSVLFTSPELFLSSPLADCPLSLILLESNFNSLTLHSCGEVSSDKTFVSVCSDKFLVSFGMFWPSLPISLLFLSVSLQLLSVSLQSLSVSLQLLTVSLQMLSISLQSLSFSLQSLSVSLQSLSFSLQSLTVSLQLLSVSLQLLTVSLQLLSVSLQLLIVALQSLTVSLGEQISSFLETSVMSSTSSISTSAITTSVLSTSIALTSLSITIRSHSV
ncbi:unnamed protein product, partial [Owenia fusiformis]